MKDINDYIPADDQKPWPKCTGESAPKASVSHHPKTQEIFLVMQATYLHRWTSQISTEELLQATMALWSRALNSLPEKSVQRALNEMPLKFVSWPPTVGEFSELCKSYGEKIAMPLGISQEYAARASVKNQDPETKSLIDKGAVVCKLIKAAYPDLNWWQVANIFTKAKVQGRKMFPNDSEADLIDKLALFSKEDFYDVHPISK